jgi:hypothetical protein
MVASKGDIGSNKQLLHNLQGHRASSKHCRKSFTTEIPNDVVQQLPYYRGQSTNKKRGDDENEWNLGRRSLFDFKDRLLLQTLTLAKY